MKGSFDDIIQDTRPVVIDFHALWCAPCKIQSPVLKEIAAELGEWIRVIKVDVDQNAKLASRFNIQSVPTLIVFKKGQILYRQSGVHSRSQLLHIITSNL